MYITQSWYQTENAISVFQYKFRFTNSFIPECAFFMTKLPFRDSKFFSDRPTALFLEFRPSLNPGLARQNYKRKKIVKKLRRQLQAPTIPANGLFIPHVR